MTIRWLRVLGFIIVVYVLIRLTIPVLINAGVPFEIRAALLTLLPLLGWKLGPWLVGGR